MGENAVKGAGAPSSVLAGELAGRRSGAAPLPVRAPGAPSGPKMKLGDGARVRAVKSSTPPWAPLKR